MDDGGFFAFGHHFTSRVTNWQRELRDLEREGVTYGDFVFAEEEGGPGTYRVTFSPAEVYQYVRGLVGWDQFLGGGFEAVADRRLAEDAAASAADRKRYDPEFEGEACPADFLGADVEEVESGGGSTGFNGFGQPTPTKTR